MNTPDGTCIAVIGMAGRFPGARNPAELWLNIREGVETVSRLTDAQLRAAGVSENDLENPAYVRAAAILDDIEMFDAEFFGFSPKDAAIMDPQHRLFLEAAWEALETAGWCSEEFQGRIGVYAGSGLNAYFIHNLLTNRELLTRNGLFLLKQTGNDKDVLATRISYQLNLTGPSVTVQTACSTSLVAIHLACQGLLNRECDMALAGGVTIEIPHRHGYVYREGEILSRDGHCRSFDANASGTIFGSGLGLVVLRRLEDAIRDGDSIRAVVRATAINNDGARKVGFLAPSVAGQAEVIAEAMSLAAVDARSISLVEAHGTGTAVGDPIEVEALTRAFRESTSENGFCAIGSLKTNLGHLDAAAGVSGFIKTVLALEHRQLPPSLNYSKPNPLINFENSPFFVNTKLREWQSNGAPRRAGVTSLGIGGTNAHAILEEAPIVSSAASSRRVQLLTLSARTPSALEAMSRNLGDHLADNPLLNLADVACVTHLGRKGFPYRRALACNNVADATKELLGPRANEIVNHFRGSEPSVIFLFSGQGAQYAGMGRELYEVEPEFRSIVDYCAEFLAAHIGMDIRSPMFADEANAEEATRLLSETRLTQPALFVIEYALAKLWLSLGIEPAAMFGHSIGEYACACVAGVFSLEDALRIVAERGRLMQSMPTGTMTAVPLGEGELTKLIRAPLAMASINSDLQCVVSGPDAAISELVTSLAADGTTCQRLRTSHAFHSPMMDPILDSFASFVGQFKLSAPRKRYVSCVTGTWITDVEATGPRYWSRQLRQTVRFADGMTLLLEDKNALFLEVGPGRTLTGLAAQHSQRAGHKILPSMRSERDDTSDERVLLLALGHLWTAGRRIDWRRFHSHETRRRMPLPTYPFERKRYWIDAGEQSATAPSSRSDPESASVAASGLLHPTWKRGDFTPQRDLTELAGPWLLFKDPEGMGAEIADLLQRRGLECIEVTPGKGFKRLTDTKFQIDPANRSDYDKLIADLQEGKRLPRVLVHLWSVTGVVSLQASVYDLNAIQDFSFYSLLFLAQALGSAAVTEQLRVGVISNNLQSVTGELVLRPERALLMGPCGVIPKELPNIRCQSIDITLPAQGSHNGHGSSEHFRNLAAQIVAELRTNEIDAVVAYRNNQRWIRAIEKLHIGERDLGSLLRERGVYLITGGLGGIGLTLAESLAKSVQARLVLIGRSPLPPRDQWARLLETDGPLADTIRRIQSIETHHGEVLSITADVSDPEAVRAVVRQVHARFGELNGVIHGAGTLDDCPILQKDSDRAACVINPKLRGTLNVEAAVQNEPLDFLIVLSSVSTLLAPAGQIDYVAANAFLDSFAQARSHNKSFPTIAIQFPRWRDVGLAARLHIDTKSGAVHPLLSDLLTDEGDQTVYSTTLRLDRDWIVGEHRLKNSAGLFPGTGYIEMVRAAVAVKAPSATLRFTDLQFKAPLRVEPGTSQAVRTVLTKLGAVYSFSVLAEDCTGPGVLIECASGEVELLSPNAAPRRDIQAIQRRCRLGRLLFDDEHNQKQSQHITFGPRWNALKRVDIGKKEAFASLELKPEFVDELNSYSFHPALFDMATGAAMFLIRGYDSIDCLYVPMSYGELTIHGKVTARCYSHIRVHASASIKDPVATFDITVLDETGNVVVEIKDFALRQLPDGSVLASAAPSERKPPSGEIQASSLPSRELRDREADSISPTEGALAFEQILRGAREANITVFPGDLAMLLERYTPPRITPELSREVAATGSLPRDEIEITLTNWWKDLLGVETISTRDDFFALGGQSLTALRLFALIRKTYKVELTLPVLFSLPTIEKLAKLVRKEETPRTYTAVIPIQPRGSKSPLFLLHGLRGNVTFYSELIRNLEPDQPIYGIQSQIMAGVQTPLTKLEELAAYYLNEIRSVQPDGPYNFLGYSYGGVLAFEMARQLHAVRQSVGLLGMLDTREMSYLRQLKRVERNSQKFYRIGNRLYQIARRVTLGPWRVNYLKETLSERYQYHLVPRAMRTIYGTFIKRGRPLPKVFRKDYQINQLVLDAYLPTFYPGRITLFKAQHGIASTDERFGPDLGWRDLVGEGVEVHEIPGTHEDLMREPNVRALGITLTSCLDRLYQREVEPHGPLSVIHHERLQNKTESRNLAGSGSGGLRQREAGIG